VRRAALVALGLLALAASPRSTPQGPAPRQRPSPAVAKTIAAPVRTVAAPAASPDPTPVVTAEDLERLRARALAFPVPEITPGTVPGTFHDRRAGHEHEALDVAAPRGAAVVAVDDGTVVKLFRSVPGGLTLYVFDDDRRYAYYYAHLDRYVPGLAEGQRVKRGETLGYVGSTGNAAEEGPHLHFAIFKLEPEPRWWRGTPLDPRPLLVPSR
jgi:murein DD-endopeptidase MepM/ murein hydrolase activator NlpD